MSVIFIVAILYFLLVLVSCLVALIISMANRYFFNLRNTEYWLIGLLLLSVSSVVNILSIDMQLPYVDFLVAISLLGAFMLYGLGYYTYNNDSVSCWWFLVPAFIIVTSLLEIHYQNKFIVGGVLTLTALLACNFYSAIYLIVKLKNLHIFFKFCGIFGTPLYALTIVVYRFMISKLDLDISLQSGDYNLLFWIFLCFSHLLLTLNMILICLGRLNNKVKQKNIEQAKINKIITHDLHSAISSIYSGLQLLEDNYEDRNGLILRLEKTAFGAQDLLFNVLKWFGNKSKNSSKANVNMKDVIGRVIGFLSLKIESKDVRIVFRNQSELYVRVDEIAVETILRNILSNAIKFSHKKGSIIIDYGVRKRMLQLSVRDFGVGMSTEQLEKINGYGINVSTKGTEGEMGSAIGLNIVKDLLINCSGKMHFISSLNKGTEVIIQIPIDNK